MTEKTYAAMFEPTEDGFGISFPDLPGCVSFGTNLDDGVRQAREALSLHLEGMAEDGEPLPDQSDYREMVDNPENPQHVAWALITVEAPDAADRVNVYLPRSLLERVDRYVVEHAPMNRSTFFSEAARNSLQRHSVDSAEVDAWVNARVRAHKVLSRWPAPVNLVDVLENAGLTGRFDFEVPHSDRQGPDVIVRMPSNGIFAIDAKFNLNPYLEAMDADTIERRDTALAKHAGSFSEYVDWLSSRSYWAQFSQLATPEFVVMFVPGDGFLEAAVELVPDLLSRAMKHQVVPLTPTTLYAVSKALMYGWAGYVKETTAAEQLSLHEPAQPKQRG